MTWILLILSVSSVLIGNIFFILQKEKEKKKKKKKKREKRAKRVETKPHAITVTWSHLSSMTKSF